MRISIEDYESRALDYVEGNLPADELPAFEAFLSEHPDLGREIRSMRGSVPVLPAEKWVYPDKKALLRGGIGVSVWLNRAGSFLGGMAAACLLIGVFVLVDRHDSSRDDALLARGIPAGQPEVERRQESASALVSNRPCRRSPPCMSALRRLRPHRSLLFRKAPPCVPHSSTNGSIRCSREKWPAPAGSGSLRPI